MSLPGSESPREPLRLTVVHGTRVPVSARSANDWRRVANAILACTRELGQHLLEQRWGRVAEVIGERRELIAWLGGLELDGEGRRCLAALRQAADESESAIARMMGSIPGTQ